MPSWVSSGSVAKYHRAVRQLKAEGKEATEEAVKALYIKYAGLVIGDAESVPVSYEDLGIRELRKLAKDKGIETEGVEREELIAALQA